MNNKNEKLIIFDCYKTLVFKEDLSLVLKKFLKEKFNKNIPIKFIDRAYELIYYRHKFIHADFKTNDERTGFYMKYNRELFGIIGLEISDDLNKEFNFTVSRLSYKCFPDALRCVESLFKQDIDMGLLANWTGSLGKVLNDLDIKKYFKFVFSSSDIGASKPNLDFFKKSIGDTMNKYKWVYYVGDDYQLDIAPARQLGLIPLLIDRDDSYPSAIDCVKLKSLGSLPRAIYRGNSKLNNNCSL